MANGQGMGTCRGEIFEEIGVKLRWDIAFQMLSFSSGLSF